MFSAKFWAAFHLFSENLKFYCIRYLEKKNNRLNRVLSFFFFFFWAKFAKRLLFIDSAQSVGTFHRYRLLFSFFFLSRASKTLSIGKEEKTNGSFRKKQKKQKKTCELTVWCLYRGGAGKIKSDDIEERPRYPRAIVIFNSFLSSSPSRSLLPEGLGYALTFINVT